MIHRLLLDYILVILIFILIFPIMSLIFILILSQGGKPIYRDKRVTKNDKIFSCYKFRTMKVNSDNSIDKLLENDEYKKQWDKYQKLLNDPRITWYGKFLRRSCLDELPQLINILKGDMSLVGPRPIAVEEKDIYPNNSFKKYISVKPGLTGWWQIKRSSNVIYSDRVAMNDYYVDNRSLFLDLKIIFFTIFTVINGKGIN